MQHSYVSSVLNKNENVWVTMKQHIPKHLISQTDMADLLHSRAPSAFQRRNIFKSGSLMAL